MIKRSQLDVFVPQAIVYCYIKFKINYLKSLKLFSIRVKELSEPIVCEEKATGFSTFYKDFLEKPIFGVTLDDFTVKNAKLGREILICI